MQLFAIFFCIISTSIISVCEMEKASTRPGYKFQTLLWWRIVSLLLKSACSATEISRNMNMKVLILFDNEQQMLCSKSAVTYACVFAYCIKGFSQGTFKLLLSLRMPIPKNYIAHWQFRSRSVDPVRNILIRLFKKFHSVAGVKRMYCIRNK